MDTSAAVRISPSADQRSHQRSTTDASVGATIRPDHLAAAADACAAGLENFDGPRGISAGDAVRRYGAVAVLLSDGSQRLCLTVRQPGLHRRRVFLPQGLHIAELLADWRYVPAEQLHRDHLAYDLPELTRRVLPVLQAQPQHVAHVAALLRALRDQLPAVEAAAMAGLPVITPWSLPSALIPRQDDYGREHDLLTAH